MANQEVSIEKIAFDYIKDYSHYITKSRVLPHLDLKPVQKRILWALICLKARKGTGRLLKSSTVAGATAQYHPHGDCYSTICNMINMPNALIEGKGNFGGIYGDSCAASRYTECRTSELFEHILDDYALELGDFVPNYDESSKEPVMFQTLIPVALLMGVHGIGIGMSTASPAFHIDYIKLSVKLALEGLPPETMEYAYGGTIYENRVYPDFKISKKNYKDYLHITSIPIGASAKIFNNSPLITELVSNKIIEIIDESTCDTVSIFIKAPQDIQDIILNSMSLPIIHNFKFYWKKLRSSGYVETWLEERKKFVERREYFIKYKEWESSFIKICLQDINKSNFNKSNFQTISSNIVNINYEKYIIRLPIKTKEFQKTLEDYKDGILSRPISSIKDYGIKDISEIKEFSEEDIKNIIISEVDSIDSSLFSPKTKIGKNFPYATFDKKIKRYIALRDNSIEVKFNKIGRVVNWETETNPIIIHQNGKTENMSPYFYGTKEDETNKIVGFTLPGSPAVIITESNKLRVLSRLGFMNEPIKTAFPAKKLNVNGKEYVVKNGLTIDNVSSYKILET